MKENKKYHGVSKAQAEAGFSDTLNSSLPPSLDPWQNAINELDAPTPDGEAKGFLERQNVYERI